MHNSKPPEKLSFNEFAMEEKYENHRSRGMRVELFSSLLIKSRQTIFYLRCYCSRSSPIKVRLSRFGINWDPNLCFVISGDDLTLSWIGAVLSFLISWDVTEVPHKKCFPPMKTFQALELTWISIHILIGTWERNFSGARELQFTEGKLLDVTLTILPTAIQLWPSTSAKLQIIFLNRSGFELRLSFFNRNKLFSFVRKRNSPREKRE